MLDMPFAFPKPDPIVMNRRSGEVAKAGPFFGQDRFETFKWRLKQNGLRPRRGA